MTRQQEAFQQIQSNSFSYTQPEWDAICQTLLPWEDEQYELECRRKLERLSWAYLMGVAEKTFGKRCKDQAKRWDKLACQFDAAASTLSEIGASSFYKEAENLRLEREGHLDWLRSAANSARNTAELCQTLVPSSNRACAPRNSVHIDLYWSFSLIFYTELGLEVNQSRHVINFLVACAKPFAEESVATPDAARRYLRVRARWELEIPAMV